MKQQRTRRRRTWEGEEGTSEDKEDEYMGRRGRNVRGQGERVHGKESPRRSKWQWEKEKVVRKDRMGERRIKKR